MRSVHDEMITLFWMTALAVFLSWLFNAWQWGGWLLVIVISLRWLLGLWMAENWLRSGGRRLNALWAGPLADFLYAVSRLLMRERKQSQQLLGRARYFKNAAEALPEGVLAVDSQGYIAWFNQGSMRLLGLRRRNRGQAVERVLRLPDVLALLSGELTGPIELESPVSAGRVIELELTPFLQGHRLVMIRDITAFKRNDAVRRDFVANASHELRTPLTVMQGYVETMLDTPGCHHDVWHKPMQQMHNQTERMRKIVEDMLMLSSLEGTDQRLRQEVVAVPQLLMQIAEEAKQLSGTRQHQIHLSCETDAGLLGHEEYLRSAFTNLVSNAVRYTPDEGRIDIRWWQDGQGLHLSVCDSGIGIAPEHLPRIMERFYRVDSARSRATGGTGLGLAITRHVLERHNAYLQVESELGKGSCFSCHFA